MDECVVTVWCMCECVCVCDVLRGEKKAICVRKVGCKTM